MCGGGNQFIFSSLIECLAKNKIDKDDTIIIMWTNVTRQDGYENNVWSRNGNLYNNKKEVLLNDFRGMFLRDCIFIEAAKRLLDSLECQYQFHSMVPIDQFDQYGFSNDTCDILDICKVYNESLKSIKSNMYEIVANCDWQSMPDKIDSIYFLHYSLSNQIKGIKDSYQNLAGANWPSYDDYLSDNSNEPKHISNEINKFKFKDKYNTLTQQLYRLESKKGKNLDLHPSPITHLEYVQKVMPEFKISSDTVNWVHSAQQTINNGEFFYFDEYLAKRL